MLVLTISTDKPDAELGLYDGDQRLAYETWTAHRELSQTIHQKIETLLAGKQKQLADLGGIVGFAGPGSFTGLRIGLTVANALAYSLHIPIVAAQGEDWIQTGLAKLAANQGGRFAMPEYGSPPHITKPRS